MTLQHSPYLDQPIRALREVLVDKINRVGISGLGEWERDLAEREGLIGRSEEHRPW